MDAAARAPDYGGVVARRADLLIAVVCGVWAAAFLANDGAAVALAPLLGLAVLPARRHPVPATLAVSVVIAAIFAAGVSEEDQSTLAAGLYVVYTLGRHTSGVRGYLPVLALTAALTVPYGAAVVDVVFVMWLLTTTWGCGRLLRLRTDRAARAAAVAAELAARDPAVLAARVVAEERARLAGDALGVIRRGVERMREHARAAEAWLLTARRWSRSRTRLARRSPSCAACSGSSGPNPSPSPPGRRSRRCAAGSCARRPSRPVVTAPASGFPGRRQRWRAR